MIYLLKSSNYYKVGYADNVESRLNAYKTHNPDFELIGIRQGTKLDEARWHKRLKEFRLAGSEWCYITNKNTIDMLENYFSKSVQINSVPEKSSLTPDCILVYAGIKKYMNNDTLEAFPSLATLCKDLDASEPTIRKCIKELVKNEYITVRKVGPRSVYTFSLYKALDPIQQGLIENKMLSFSERAILLSEYPYMYKDPVTHLGKINHSNRKLANLINVSHSTLSRCNKSLQEKGLLQVVTTNAIDPETGCKIQEKIYNLDKLHQGIIFVLKNHEDRISNTENEIELLKKQIASLTKDYELVLKENTNLKKESDVNLIL